MRKLFFYCVLGGSLVLQGCSPNITRNRIAEPVSDRIEQVAQVDFVALVDPLGLGRERMLHRMGKLNASGYGEKFNNGDPEVDPLGVAVVENAIQGFYDPRYPEMLCRDLPGGDLAGKNRSDDEIWVDARSRQICKAFYGKRPPDADESVVSHVNRKVVKHIRQTETARTDAKGKVLGKVNTVSEIIDVKVDLEVKEIPFETPIEAFQRLRRNRIQDRMMHASQVNCLEYIEGIRLYRNGFDATFGSLDLALDAAATIFTGVAPVLSALSGTASSVGKATDFAGFNEIAMDVMVKGIEAARSNLGNDISKKQSRSIVAYTLEAALTDIAKYHGSCSVLVGLKQAGQAISNSANQSGNSSDAGNSG